MLCLMPPGYLSHAICAPSRRNFSSSLSALPLDHKFPRALKSRIYFDSTEGQLHFIGVMIEPERDILLSLSGDQPYQDAIKDLFSQPVTINPDAADIFLTSAGTGNDAAVMFDEPASPEERFLLVLEKLLPHLRLTLSKRLVEQTIAESLKLDAKSAEKLLTEWIASPSDPQPDPALKRRCIEDFLAPAFAESSMELKLIPSSFRDQFKAFLLMHKVATIAAKFKITPTQFAWIFDYGATAGWLDPNSLPTPVLPTDPQEPAASFDLWLRLADLFQLRDTLPSGEAVLSDIFSLARSSNVSHADLLKFLSEHTTWSAERSGISNQRPGS